MVNKYIETLPLNLSGKVYADETDIPRGNGQNKKGGDVFWCAVDWDTRFICSTLYSPNNQNVEDAIEFLRKTTKHGLPNFIQTDAAQFYPKGNAQIILFS